MTAVALILIGVQDTVAEDGVTPETVVAVLSEPLLPAPPLAPDQELTPAQSAACMMLQALRSEIKEDRGLIQLIN